ncbi:MAG: PH domain-containing protein [Thermoanaerobaculia bacterium]
MNGWRGVVLRFFRVPPEPEPPPGSAPRIFRAAPNYLVLKTIEWAFSLVALLIGALIVTAVGTGMLAADLDPGAKVLTAIITVVLWTFFSLRLLIGYAMIRLDYEMRWYMVSDRAIRIREGIATVKEKTMAFANIQNISLKQGPLQRLLGIADVEARTAGGGSGEGPQGKEQRHEEPMHVGYFRGVDNAEAIRDIVREGVRRQKDSGLGDPDEPVQIPHSGAEELLAEARLTRQMLERGLGMR